MVKVRILSGSQAGAVVDLSAGEAENAVATGYAESYSEPEPTPAPSEPEQVPEQPRRRGR